MLSKWIFGIDIVWLFKLVVGVILMFRRQIYVKKKVLEYQNGGLFFVPKNFFSYIECFVRWGKSIQSASAWSTRHCDCFCFLFRVFNYLVSASLTTTNFSFWLKSKSFSYNLQLTKRYIFREKKTIYTKCLFVL